MTTNNQGPSYTEPCPPERPHDELACEVAWEAHCDRHRRWAMDAVKAERERCAAIAESEPWPAGPVPLVVLAASKGLSYEQIVEATVKATRESIALKIREGRP